MTASSGEQDILRDLRARAYTEGDVFWTDPNELAVFDPDVAQQINALNFGDLRLPDKLGDILRGRSGKPLYWKQVRAAWIAQIRRLSAAEATRQLADRMSRLLDERLDRTLDLAWAAQEVFAEALLPVVVDGLSRADMARIRLDQTLKIKVLLDAAATHGAFWSRLRESWIQVSAGLVIRRELSGRARGHRPRRLDLTDPMVDLLPELGMDRAVHAVAGVLTAIAGPPGAAATCLLYALTLRQDWTARLIEELAPIPPEELYAAPHRVAPVTHRFVKETLRMWSPIPLVNRPARKEIQHERACLHAGQTYLLSPDILHHHPAHWKDPDTFDPDRWLNEPAYGREPGAGSCYAPFGWSPRSCIGASLGTTQSILLCHLLCTRFEARLADPEAVRMAMPSVHMPRNFHGTITRRER